MDLPVKKFTLQNVVVAGDVTTGNGYIYIKGLPPIRTEDYISVTYIDPTAEVQQIKALGVSAVTIAASTLYQVGIGNTRDQREGWNNSIQKFGYYSPVALAATAALDRVNAYNALAWKINNTPTTRCYAGVKATLTALAGTAITMPTGNTLPVWVSCSVSGAIGFMTATSSTTVYIFYVTNGITPVTLDILSIIPNPYTGVTSGTGGPSLAASGITTHGDSMYIVDQPNYYSAKGTRKGANTVIATAGFLPAAITTITAAVYSQGQAARMAQDVPIQEVTSGNLASGDWDFPTNDTVVSGSTYETIVVRCRPHIDNSAMSDLGTQAEIMYGIYAEKTTTGGVAAAGYAAYKAALDAL